MWELKSIGWKYQHSSRFWEANDRKLSSKFFIIFSKDEYYSVSSFFPVWYMQRLL